METAHPGQGHQPQGHSEGLRKCGQEGPKFNSFPRHGENLPWQQQQQGGAWQELCERRSVTGTVRGRRAASLTSPHSGATAPLQSAHRVMIPNQLFTISPRESEEEIGSQNQKEMEDNLSGTKRHPSWDFLWFMEQQLPPCVAAQQPKNFPRGEEIPQGFTLPVKLFDILLSWTPTSTKS